MANKKLTVMPAWIFMSYVPMTYVTPQFIRVNIRVWNVQFASWSNRILHTLRISYVSNYPIMGVVSTSYLSQPNILVNIQKTIDGKLNVTGFSVWFIHI